MKSFCKLFIFRCVFVLLLVCVILPCGCGAFAIETSDSLALATDTSMDIIDGIEPAADDSETLLEDVTSDASGFSDLMLVLGVLCGVLLWLVFAISFK